MRLHAAAKRFDDTLAADAYNPSVTFMCQFEAMSFSKIDGVAIRKRQISVEPSTLVPPRGAITIHGETYLVGHAAPDYWRNKVIRKTLVIQGADGVSAILSIADALGNLPGASAYASAVFSKYGTDERADSHFRPQYQLFFAGCEHIESGQLVHLNADWFLVKEAYLSTSGLVIALANRVDGSVFETGLRSVNDYDPLTDTYASTTVGLNVFRVIWTEDFAYATLAQETYVRGDQTMHVLKSAWPDVKPSDSMTLSDGRWRVLAVEDKGLTFALHMRRD